jgi:predicted ATPase
MRTINEIKRIEIKGLFGFLNYDIELSGQGIDVITGPNGSGKTTILRLIMAVIEQDLEGLARPLYESITVHAGTEPYEMQTLKPRVRNASVTVLTEIKIQIENLRRELKFTIDDIEVGSIYKRIRPGHEDEITGELVEETFQLDPGAQMHQKLGVFYVPQRVTVLNLSRLTALGSQQIETSIEDEITVDLSPINQLLRDSISRASQVLLDSVATSSQVLVDSVINRRMIDSSKIQNDLPLKNLSLGEVSDEFYRLKNQFITVGVKLDTTLLDQYFRSKLPPYELGPDSPEIKEESSVVEVFVRTLVAGYIAASVHTNRIFRFLTRLNNSFSNNKRGEVYFPRNGAARVRISQSNPKTNEIVEVTKGLSSGEHRYIKLFATLLLNSPTTIYIIDEPELSLHPEWLDGMIKDLEAMRGQAQYVIASHSPYLVADNLHLHTDLPACEVA